ARFATRFTSPDAVVAGAARRFAARFVLARFVAPAVARFGEGDAAARFGARDAVARFVERDAVARFGERDAVARFGERDAEARFVDRFARRGFVADFASAVAAAVRRFVLVRFAVRRDWAALPRDVVLVDLRVTAFLASGTSRTMALVSASVRAAPTLRVVPR